jgi:hypothetical protein
MLAFAPQAQAVDGVLEINQTCAVNTGCFAGDTAGFPITINTQGSYVLTSNLDLPDVNTTGIEVTVGIVTIDMNGMQRTLLPADNPKREDRRSRERRHPVRVRSRRGHAACRQRR